MLLKILGFICVFHTFIFANGSMAEDSIQANSGEVVKSQSIKEEVEVSFGNQSILYMFVLTSLLGTFFLRDELADSL